MRLLVPTLFLDQMLYDGSVLAHAQHGPYLLHCNVQYPSATATPP